ncbi:sulfotransferase family protein [Rheinheimera oceanensis]|uniref:sulfotransferase family protein n=1 Tax=Rheinheimera oceanensis TaxID=2817449 RepID=UPI001BFDE7AA|nr:sulfotransferase [Rheinheimera oceanensis]
MATFSGFLLGIIQVNVSSQYSLNDILSAVREGKRTEAQALITYFIETEPDLKTDWSKVAALAQRIGDIKLARQAADFFHQSCVKSAETDIHYAGLCAEIGDLNKALRVVSPYIARKVALPSVYHLAGTVQAQQGMLQGARLNLLQALALAPHLGISWYTLASIVDFNQHPGLLQKMEFAFSQLQADDQRNVQQFMYALAKAFNDLREYAKAWEFYKAGAQIMANISEYSVDDNTREINRLIAGFNNTSLQQLPQSRSTYNKGVAVLGLPRSGTTLLGQMLCAHSKVKGAGEFNAIGAACMHLRDNFTDFPSFIARHGHSVAALEHIANIYQQVAEQRYSGQGYIIDKSLNLNRHFGIWAQVMPLGKAIYISRNDEDTAWSCFKSNFRSQAGWSWSVSHIAAYIKNERRLLQHWQKLYANRILHIRYEDLVARPQEVLTKICQHLGLQYEPAMLSFYKSSSPVFTSSIGQVHQPLHQGNIGLSQHYPDFVSQLAQASRAVSGGEDIS